MALRSVPQRPPLERLEYMTGRDQSHKINEKFITFSKLDRGSLDRSLLAYLERCMRRINAVDVGSGWSLIVEPITTMRSGCVSKSIFSAIWPFM